MTGRDRKALIVGAGVVIAAVVALRVVPWTLKQVLTARGELAERAQMLARGREELARMPLLRDSAAVLTRAVVALALRLLDGGSAAEAGADLGARLNVAAARASAKLEQVTQVPDSTAAGRLRRVSIRAALETDVRGLAAVVRALEFGDATLTVERIEVTNPDPGSADGKMEVLRVQVTVAGWFLGRREG